MRDMLFCTAARAAPREFTVNYHSRDAADAAMVRLGGDFALVYVVDHDFMRRTGYPLDGLDCFLTR